MMTATIPEELQTTLCRLEGSSSFFLNSLESIRLRDASIYLPDVIATVATFNADVARANELMNLWMEG